MTNSALAAAPPGKEPTVALTAVMVPFAVAVMVHSSRCLCSVSSASLVPAFLQPSCAVSMARYAASVLFAAAL
ncbi:MAG: hypothetical protein RSE54_08435 [Ruthenibacterium sp.]